MFINVVHLHIHHIVRINGRYILLNEAFISFYAAKSSFVVISKDSSVHNMMKEILNFAGVISFQYVILILDAMVKNILGDKIFGGLPLNQHAGYLHAIFSGCRTAEESPRSALSALNIVLIALNWQAPRHTSF